MIASEYGSAPIEQPALQMLVRRTFQKVWNDIRLELAKFLRRAEEFGNVDRQVFDERREIVLVLRNVIEIRRIPWELSARHKVADPPLHLRLLVQVEVNLRLRLEFFLEFRPVSIIHHWEPLLHVIASM